MIRTNNLPTWLKFLLLAPCVPIRVGYYFFCILATENADISLTLTVTIEIYLHWNYVDEEDMMLKNLQKVL